MSDVSPQPSATPNGSRYPLLPGVRAMMVDTDRLRQHIYANDGRAGSERLLMVHGNASSARFFEEFIAALPEYTIIAPDLRGYGASEAKPADARRGLRDFSDDLESLVMALGWDRFHLLGWSLGGNIAMQYAIDHPERDASLTFHATGSPYGYGGSHGDDGAPNFADFAGSGGGLISPAVVERYTAQDFTADSPLSARSALRNLIVKPTFTFSPEREDALVEQMLKMTIGDHFYPGDSVPSANWPFSGPGVWGSNNALSPKYGNLSGLAEMHPQPPILWVRGADDAMVSDTAAVDPAALGKLGVIPGWPGEDVCPPQPMLRQVRATLDRYRANGGSYEERILDDCGHSPLLEKPEEFRALFRRFLGAHPIAVAESSHSDSAASESPTATAAAAVPLTRRGPFRWFRRRS